MQRRRTDKDNKGDSRWSRKRGKGGEKSKDRELKLQ